MGETSRRDGRDGDLITQLDTLVTDAGGDIDDLSGKLGREMMHTAIKFLRDGADTGEMKVASRSLKEFRYAMKVFRDYRGVPKVSIFGSARTPPDHVDYQQAVAFGRRMAESGWMVITGAGGGIMAAGHDGAGRDKSFGVGIRLPFETVANETIEGDSKLIIFRYFFTRKLMFASQADAFVLFPGGFGTQDEGFEILTLIQTGKSPLIPVVMIEPTGGTYWKRWDEYVRSQLLDNGWICAEDLNLYHITNDIEDAAEHVQRFYRNYHSMRFVRDTLVMRIRHALTDAQLDAINDEFSRLVADGRMQQGSILPEESEHLELPRLYYTSTRRDYGLLRAMIDRINGFVE